MIGLWGMNQEVSGLNPYMDRLLLYFNAFPLTQRRWCIKNSMQRGLLATNSSFIKRTVWVFLLSLSVSELCLGRSGLEPECWGAWSGRPQRGMGMRGVFGSLSAARRHTQAARLTVLEQKSPRSPLCEHTASRPLSL